jgi:amino acid transporter
MNMIGQVAITAGINIGAAMYLLGAAKHAFGLSDDFAVPLFGTIAAWPFKLFVMVLLMIPQVLLNIFGIRVVARLNVVSVWWHIGGVLLIAALLTIWGQHHNPIGFLFSAATPVNPFDASLGEINGVKVAALVAGNAALPSPLFRLFPALGDFYKAAPFAFVFVLGMLQAQWTYTGYDASAHVAEETVMARKNSAWGVFLSVGVSAVVGYVLLLILTWCIPNGDVAATANDEYPVLQIAYGSLGRFAANVIAVIIAGAMWLCGCSSITSMARMWYAFARDNGMPGSRLIKQVNGRYRTPVWSILITSALAVVICIYSAAYYVVTSISTITLYLAYVIPIYLNWRNKRRGCGECATPDTAPWNLGRWGAPINVVAILWTLFITIIFSLPPNELVLWTMVLVALLLFAYWKLHAARHFQGPTRADAVALEKIQAR